MDSDVSFFYPAYMNDAGYYVINTYYKIKEKTDKSISIDNQIYQVKREILNKRDMEELLNSMGLGRYASFMSTGIRNQLLIDRIKKAKIMGILNLTPDSFYSGSRFMDKSPDQIIDSGADIIDVGGESTRPGSIEIDPEIEIKRLITQLPEIRNKFKGMISLDSRHHEVIRAVLPYIDVVNDVSGLKDERIPEIAVENKLKYVLMHLKGDVNRMTENESYDDLPGEIAKFFIEKLRKLEEIGMKPDDIIIDPGLGFSKNAHHDYFLIKNINVFSFGFPRLIGHSRKRFTGYLTGSKIEDRLPETLAISLYLESKGIEILRVHDVSENIRFLEEYRFLSQT
ncbi:dihydropteroate synthase [Cuniculiplasma sp. SKW3]|uniref:dihydropteroate synthase n=1 Tax=Cuniculiplasma sp. SKW3 TaxID=3400170 RepID=UPI003FD57CA4